MTAADPASRTGTWPVRLIATLHLLTTLALSFGYLLPAALLAVLVAMVPNWAYEVLTTGTPLWVDFLLLAVPPGIALGTFTARLACGVQRRRLESLYGVEARTPEPMADGGRVSRALRYFFGAEAWGAVLHSTVVGLWGMVVGSVILVLIAFGVGVPLGVLGLVGALTIGLFSPEYVDWLGTAILVLVSPAAVVLGLWLAPVMVHVEATVTQSLLLNSSEMRARRRMTELVDSRLRMVDAAEAERKRIERDLHDGVQQRLLAVTMTLARARARLDQDADRTRALLEQAQSEAKEVMAELREIARGLHPRVLTDHGLESALPVAASRCPVPVRLHVDLPERPSPRAEGVAYYIVCEGLANVAKHAGARTVAVRAERVEDGPILRVTITDDGRGGADPGSGNGLAGLRDRLRAVDGTLAVHSPAGGPTELAADIPWRA